MLNQLDNLTERVRGSNKLVDRWLHVRKHLLVAYYNLVGIKRQRIVHEAKRKKPLMILSEHGRLLVCRTFQYL